MTDENGLIYMRTRYYSPNLRRFINADIVSGKISNAITLNRYAYANGNPVSFVDPFGLSAEERGSAYGSVIYQGNIYDIYVPNHLINVDESGWETVDEFSRSDFSFDWLQFLTGIEIDDANGILDGSNTGIVTTTKPQYLKVFGLSLFLGSLNSVVDSTNKTYITFQFQQKEDEKRVIIKVGSSDVKKLTRAYANGSSHFFPQGSGCAVNTFRESMYHFFTGKTLAWYEYGQARITMDKAHKGSGDTAYLWISSDGTVMQTPIIYPDDEIVIGKTFFWVFGYQPEVVLPINNTVPVSPAYQAVFDKAIVKDALDFQY